MADTYVQLFEHIRERCQRVGWYGGHLDCPRGSHMRPDHPQRTGFAYTTASEEQLRATEAALEFSLPPVLRALYAQVANGGFGFGYGLRGAMGGFDGRGSGTIVDQYLARSCSEEILPWAGEKIRLIDLADYDGRWEEVTGEYRDKVVRTFRYLILPYHLWPERFLPICYWGCSIECCLDSVRGGVYRVGVTKEEGHLISLQAPSLQDMLEG